MPYNNYYYSTYNAVLKVYIDVLVICVTFTSLLLLVKKRCSNSKFFVVKNLHSVFGSFFMGSLQNILDGYSQCKGVLRTKVRAVIAQCSYQYVHCRNFNVQFSQLGSLF